MTIRVDKPAVNHVAFTQRAVPNKFNTIINTEQRASHNNAAYKHKLIYTNVGTEQRVDIWRHCWKTTGRQRASSLLEQPSDFTLGLKMWSVLMRGYVSTTITCINTTTVLCADSALWGSLLHVKSCCASKAPAEPRTTFACVPALATVSAHPSHSRLPISNTQLQSGLRSCCVRGDHLGWSVVSVGLHALTRNTTKSEARTLAKPGKGQVGTSTAGWVVLAGNQHS
jgi:hypothetical protein